MCQWQTFNNKKNETIVPTENLKTPNMYIEKCSKTSNTYSKKYSKTSNTYVKVLNTLRTKRMISNNLVVSY